MFVSSNQSGSNIIFSASPLMPGVPLRTEARRNRSRSRGRVDSQLVRRVDQIPAIHNAVEYLISTYCIIKVRYIEIMNTVFPCYSREVTFLHIKKPANTNVDGLRCARISVLDNLWT